MSAQEKLPVSVKRCAARVMPPSVRSMWWNWFFLKTLTRPQWIYGADIKIPTYQLTLTPAAHAVTSAGS